MTINDFYFKFDNYDSADSALVVVGIYRNAEGKLTSDNRSVSVDEVGVIYRDTGLVTIVAGESVPVTEAIDGWHVNVRSFDDGISASLENIGNREHPETPSQLWAKEV